MRLRDIPALRRRGAAVMLCATLLATSLTAWAEPDLERIRAVAQAGDPADALAQLDARLAEHPDDRDALFLRAQVLAWSGDFA
ncbi:MAG: tetratricopeptide repeat protein, partial [Steroidobacteraceae bacterium]